MSKDYVVKSNDRNRRRATDASLGREFVRDLLSISWQIGGEEVWSQVEQIDCGQIGIEM